MIQHARVSESHQIELVGSCHEKGEVHLCPRVSNIFLYSGGISDLTQNIIMFMFDTLILGTKKISMIACGQTSSMALSDAGEVRVKRGQTRKRFFNIYVLINFVTSKETLSKACPLHKHNLIICNNIFFALNSYSN